MAEMTGEQLEVLRSLCEGYASRRGWSLHERLGFGGSAAVYRMQTEKGDVALKVYIPSFLQGPGGLAEHRRVDLQKGLIGHSCQSLVRFIQIDFEAETCFIQMEYFPWPDLSKCLADIPRTAIYALIEQLVSAVTFLESRNLVHRDIKPANILVSPAFERLVVIDLGVVRDTSEDEDRPDGTDHGTFKPFIATYQYSSPEYLFRTLPPSPDLWKALTIYQVGGVLHDLLARKPLFYEEAQTANRYAVAYAVQQKIPSFDGIPDVPPHLKNLALHCLSKDPGKRLRLVKWEDFSAPTNDLAGLQKRLIALEAARTRQFVEQQEALRTSLDQRDFASKLFEQTSSVLKERFADGIMLEHVAVEPNRCLFRWHFASISWVMDLSVEVRWPENAEDVGAQPDIVVGARLLRSTTPHMFNASAQIGTASPKSENVVAMAELVAGASAHYLSHALDIFEQGVPNEELQLGE